VGHKQGDCPERKRKQAQAGELTSLQEERNKLLALKEKLADKSLLDGAIANVEMKIALIPQAAPTVPAAIKGTELAESKLKKAAKALEAAEKDVCSHLDAVYGYDCAVIDGAER
jgi:hypothetical protein